jgi:hypothetical protein
MNLRNILNSQHQITENFFSRKHSLANKLNFCQINLHQISKKRIKLDKTLLRYFQN